MICLSHTLLPENTNLSHFAIAYILKYLTCSVIEEFVTVMEAGVLGYL